MNTKRYVMPAVVLGCLLAGCTSLAPNVDKHFGEANSLAKASQIIDLEASQKTQAQSFDGVAAVESVGQYQKSFKAPPKTGNVFTIGVGSGTAGAGGTSGGSK